MDIYAVTGKPIAHSLSPELFNHAFQKEGIEAVYTRLGVDTAGQALDLAGQIGLRGLNVTAPFKEEMAAMMDRLDSQAREIGAVNGVVFREGLSLGFNTDPQGVIGAFARNGVELRGKEAAVIGAGGAAQAAVYGLTTSGANVRVLNRNFSRAAKVAERFGCRPEPIESLPRVLRSVEIVIAAVSAAESPVKPGWLRPGQVLLDASYSHTKLSALARRRGCRVVDGSDWLLFQAAAAFHFFAGRQLDPEVLREALVSAAARRVNRRDVSLIGMMGAGKTTVGKTLAAVRGLECIDTDAMVEKKAGISISRIFESRGEDLFRRLESRVLGQLGGEKRRTIYALGGGALSRPDNREIVKNHSFVIWLWTDPDQILNRIPPDGRPLLGTADRRRRLADILAARLPDYALASDLVIDANRPLENVVRKILDEVH